MANIDTLRVGGTDYAIEDATARADIGDIRTDLSDYHVVPSKNLLENKVLSYTQAVGTYTYSVSSDGKITVNGSDTATARVLTINNPYDITPYIGQDLVISGCVGGGDNTFRLYCNIRDSGGNLLINPNSKDGATSFTVPNNAAYAEVGILLYGGQTFTNKVFEPMICTAADYAADPSYEPYWVCMRDGKVDWDFQKKNGAYNICPNNAVTATDHGVTWTVNADKTVSTSGSATGGNSIFPIATLTLPAGTYVATGCPNYESSDIFFQIIGTGVDFKQRNHGAPLVFTLSASTTVTARLVIANTLASENKTWKPMITTDLTATYENYVPYAMTNRELTDAKVGKGKIASSIDLNNVTETGIYYVDTGNAHRPEDNSYFTLIVEHEGANSIRQFVIRHDVHYSRRYTVSDGIWTSWYKFTGTAVV